MYLTKSTFMSGYQCTKKLFMERYEGDHGVAIGSGAQLRFRDGQAVDVVVRCRWPRGVLVDVPGSRHEEAVERTSILMEDPTVPAVFQGAFTGLDVQIRTDVLQRSDDGVGWHLIEVKSSTSPKPEHIRDIAVQTAVLRDTQVDLRNTSLLYLDRDYVLGSTGVDPTAFSVIEDKTAEVGNILSDTKKQISEYLGILASGNRPNISPGPHCKQPYACKFWDYCTSSWPDDHISTLPNLLGTRRQGLVDLGIRDIREIPTDYSLTDRQERVREAVVTGTDWRSDDLELSLKELQGQRPACCGNCKWRRFRVLTKHLPIWARANRRTTPCVSLSRQPL